MVVGGGGDELFHGGGEGTGEDGGFVTAEGALEGGVGDGRHGGRGGE